MSKRLAVIGGGPKGVAIATKATALRAAAVADIEVTIFEKARVGAHWDGQSGYTDGVQRLCTPAERDLGFPYDAFPDEDQGVEVTRQMIGRFSWQAYCISGRANPTYMSWVDDGCRPPRHKEFADYLKWAVDESDATVVTSAARKLTPRPDGWQVTCADAGQSPPDPFDAVVVTGPGPAKRVPHGADRRVFDGCTFWQSAARIERIARRVRRTGGTVAIIGTGGTAAAIAAWFVDHGFADLRIRLMADRASLFVRVGNLFENRVHTNPNIWELLSPEQRIEFSTRLNRGVVWADVSARLAEARDLEIVPGRVLRIEDPEEEGGELIVAHRTAVSPEPYYLPAELVIDATGFDPWWFAKLLPAKLLPRDAPGREKLEKDMLGDFQLSLPGVPPLHVPTRSLAIGPGYSSLMALGGMADLILKSYCPNSIYHSR